VGRYLTNATGSSLDKEIKPGELATILASSLTVFPIFETTGIASGYFTDSQGFSDAMEAVTAASEFGFIPGTTIYYAVDCDPTGDDIQTNVIPYFQGINRLIALSGAKYSVGVYGTRNVCAQLEARYLASNSFVAGMSTGFSGNLGFALPGNWAFDQIATVTVGTDGGQIEIDNDISSGRDRGQGAVQPPPSDAKPDVSFDMALKDALSQDIVDRCATVTSNTALLIHPNPADCVTALLVFDELITVLSNQWGIRKALIESVAFWEYWKQTAADPAADTLVQMTYEYLEAKEQFPLTPPPTLPLRYDSSTGFAQMFASTAIWAHNWAVGLFLTDGPTWDGSDWHTVWNVWQQLHDSVPYNLSMVPPVLMAGAAEIGVTSTPRLVLTADEITRILGRYNGTGDAARSYGYELKSIYDIFEGYNALLRAGG